MATNPSESLAVETDDPNIEVCYLDPEDLFERAHDVFELLIGEEGSGWIRSGETDGVAFFVHDEKEGSIPMCMGKTKMFCDAEDLIRFSADMNLEIRKSWEQNVEEIHLLESEDCENGAKCQSVYYRVGSVLNGVISPRDFVMDWFLGPVQGYPGSWITAAFPSNREYPEVEGVVRGECFLGSLIAIPIPESERSEGDKSNTYVYHAMQTDPRGYIPSMFLEKAFRSSIISILKNLRDKFHQE